MDSCRISKRGRRIRLGGVDSVRKVYLLHRCSRRCLIVYRLDSETSKERRNFLVGTVSREKMWYKALYHCHLQLYVALTCSYSYNNQY